jgi:hypothetical protein
MTPEQIELVKEALQDQDAQTHYDFIDGVAERLCEVLRWARDNKPNTENQDVKTAINALFKASDTIGRHWSKAEKALHKEIKA